jgi:tetratricopeptide (TPR) repeat protein
MWKPTLLLFLSLAAIAQVQSPQALVEDAMNKQRAGDFEGAVRGYREFLKLHPEAAPIRSNLGASLAGLGRFEEAVVEYKKVLRVAPSTQGTRLNLALAYYKMGRIADATDQLVKVHTQDPANQQATLLLADCYLRMDQNKDVIRILQPVSDANPNNLAIAYLLGTALIRDKQAEKGQVLVDRILRNGESAEAHLMMGSAKMGVADFAGARDEFAKAAELNPNLPEVHVLYAQSLSVTGSPDQAMKEYQAELAVDPYNFVANLQIAAMLRQEQNYEEAKKYLDRALKTRPGDLAVRYQLAAIALSEGHYDNARTQLESIVKESPQFTEAHVSLSLAYFRLKRPEEGKREREIVEKLTAEAQAKQSGAKSQ